MYPRYKLEPRRGADSTPTTAGLRPACWLASPASLLAEPGIDRKGCDPCCCEHLWPVTGCGADRADLLSFAAPRMSLSAEEHAVAVVSRPQDIFCTSSQVHLIVPPTRRAEADRPGPATFLRNLLPIALSGHPLPTSLLTRFLPLYTLGVPICCLGGKAPPDSSSLSSPPTSTRCRDPRRCLGPRVTSFARAPFCPLPLVLRYRRQSPVVF